MAAPMDTGPCADCGEVVTSARRYLRHGGRRDHLCLPCAAARAVEVNRQIRERRGPAYDHWRDAMAAVGDRLRRPE